MKVHKEPHTSEFATFDDIDAIVLVANSKGDIIYASKAVKNILGYEPEELLGNGWWELVSEDEQDRIERKECAADMASGVNDLKHQRLYENRNRAKNGDVVWTQWTNSLTQSGNLIGVGQVITEKKETEAKLKRYSQQIELLHAIDKIILSLAPLDERIEKVLEELEKNISFVCRTTLSVFDHEAQTAKLYRKDKVNGKVISNIFTVPLSAIRSAKELVKGNYFIVKDLFKESELSATDIQNKADGIVSYLAVPIFYGEKLSGALFLCSDTTNPFNAHDIELSKDVANSFSLAIEQTRLEQSLIKKNAEKELLLKEIHHRVKNNLQVISSLLNMQSYTITDHTALEAFQKSKDRIKAMALIHTKLYESKNLSEIAFQEYLNQLLESIAGSYASGSNIKWSSKVSEVTLDVDLSINLGLIITELITNSFKHAFKETNKGQIKVELKSLSDNKYQLIVEDNGVGLPEGFKINESTSLGLEIVQSLIEQIDGVLEISSKKGTTFKISFENNKQHLSKS